MNRPSGCDIRYVGGIKNTHIGKLHLAGIDRKQLAGVNMKMKNGDQLGDAKKRKTIDGIHHKPQ